MIKMNDLKKGTKLKLTKGIEGISYKKGDIVSVHGIENNKVLLKFGLALGVFSIKEVNEYFEMDKIIKKELFNIKVNKSEVACARENIESSLSVDEIKLKNKINMNPFSERIYEFTRKDNNIKCEIIDSNTDKLLGKGVARLKKGEPFNLEIGINVAKLKAEIDMNNRELELINIKIDTELSRNNKLDNWLNSKF